MRFWRYYDVGYYWNNDYWDNSGTITYGNTLNISSIRTEKSFHGSGGGNTGNVVIEMTGPSSTNTIDLTGVAANSRKHLNEARVRHSK